MIVTRNCERCGLEYSRRGRRVLHRFCSIGCAARSRRGRIPWNKDKSTGIAPWRGKRRAPETIQKIRNTKALHPYQHTEETKTRISKKLLGASRGGVAKFALRLRGTSPYKKWRRAIYLRDGFTCQFCGTSGGKLNADHIVGFASLLKYHGIKSMQEAFECGVLWALENGRTLCLDCHKTTKTFGNRKAS